MRKQWMIFAIAALLMTSASLAAAQSYAYGDTADEIAVIQEALTELDLYYADVTGHYGRKTERAVMLFQRKYRLAQTGVADDATLSKLYLVTGIAAPDVKTNVIGASTVLRRGSNGDAVRILQENLTALGFYTGEITGSYGGLTQEAVRRFQRKYDLDSDGIAGRNTLSKLAVLMGDMNGASGSVSSGSAGPTDSSVTLLRLNVKNDAVRKLQEDLTLLGYYKGDVTGKYGNLTKEAVRRFQRDNDLASDGVAGPLTLAEIADELADEVGDASDADTATPPSAGTTTDVTTGTSTGSTAGTTAVGSTVSLSDVTLLNTERTLRKTSSSGYVTRLQNALNALGYFPQSATGYFGSQTEEAVKAYQSAKGLKADGIAGRATLTAINKDIKEKLEGKVD